MKQMRHADMIINLQASVMSLKQKSQKDEARRYIASEEFKDILKERLIGIASSDQVQRQQRRDEPVRKNTHLVLDTLASRLRSYHSIVGVESLVFWVIRTQFIYIQGIVCMSG